MTYRERHATETKKLFEGFEPDVSRAHSPVKILAVRDLAAAGLYSKEIAELIGSTPKAVQKIFRRYDFPTLHNFAPPLREERPGWAGGVKIANGYAYARTPEHPNGSKYGGYVAVHRLVVEKEIGRYLTREEVVDHIDGDVANNHPDNLRLFPNNAEHLRVTLKGRRPNWSEEGKAAIRDHASSRRRTQKGTFA